MKKFNIFTLLFALASSGCAVYTGDFVTVRIFGEFNAPANVDGTCAGGWRDVNGDGTCAGDEGAAVLMSVVSANGVLEKESFKGYYPEYDSFGGITVELPVDDTGSTTPSEAWPLLHLTAYDESGTERLTACEGASLQFTVEKLGGPHAITPIVQYASDESYDSVVRFELQ